MAVEVFESLADRRQHRYLMPELESQRRAIFTRHFHEVREYRQMLGISRRPVFQLHEAQEVTEAKGLCERRLIPSI